MIKFKIIFVLGCLAGAAGLWSAFGAADAYNHERNHALSSRLSRTRDLFESERKIEVRKDLDDTIKAADDWDLIDALDQLAKKGPQTSLSDLDANHPKALARLKAINVKLKVDLLLVTNREGRVLARLGQEEKYGDGVGAIPVVADAIRGYVRDDSLPLEGNLYRVVAVPVIMEDRIVGSLVSGRSISDASLRTWKQKFGCDVTYFYGNTVKASTLDGGSNQAFPSILSSQAGQLKNVFTSGKVLAPQSISLGKKGFWAQFAPITGGSKQNRGGYALLVPAIMESVSPLALFMGLPGSQTFPVTSAAVAGGFFLVFFGLGLLLLHLEVSGPLGNLIRSTVGVTLEKKMPEEEFSGTYRRVVQAINQMLNKIQGEMASQLQQARAASAGAADISTILPQTPSEPELEPSFEGIPGLEKKKGKGEPAPLPVEEDDPFADMDDDGGSPMASTPDPFSPSPPSRPMPPPPPPPSRHSMPKSSSFISESTVVAEIPEELLAKSAAELEASMGITRDPREEHFRQVYQEFVSTKRRCGEPLEGLSYDKFASKLKRSEDDLRNRYPDCREVRFQVHVKDGKAALKATPVKD